MHSPRAQTTCLVLFGPIFVLIGYPFPIVAHSSCIRTYIYNKTFVSQKKNESQKRHLPSPNDISGIVGAHFRPCWLPFPYTVAQKIAPMFACYGKTHALLNDYIR